MTGWNNDLTHSMFGIKMHYFHLIFPHPGVEMYLNSSSLNFYGVYARSTNYHVSEDFRILEELILFANCNVTVWYYMLWMKFFWLQGRQVTMNANTGICKPYCLFPAMKGTKYINLAFNLENVKIDNNWSILISETIQYLCFEVFLITPKQSH